MLYLSHSFLSIERDPRQENVDFVSRFFAPKIGIPEDPVTGSSHTSLLPLWSKKLGKTSLVAEQLSKRGGNYFANLKVTDA